MTPVRLMTRDGKRLLHHDTVPFDTAPHVIVWHEMVFYLVNRAEDTARGPQWPGAAVYHHGYGYVLDDPTRRS